jgi:DNA-binding CsgD family transcriptional regulator
VERLVRISVFIALSDPLVGERMTSLLAGEGFDIVADDRLADVVVADHAGPFAGPAIVIADGTRNPRALNDDIRAVLPSTTDAELLGAAIRIAAAGFMIEKPASADGDGEIALTGRESEVLSLLAEGASNKAIARALDISVHTAKYHVASVLAKLGARNRSDAVAIGMRRGLILL